MRGTVFAGFVVAAALGCNLAGAPNKEGLRAGRYRAQFDIVASTLAPAVAVGHHDFTFVAVEPTATRDNFTVISANIGDRAFYLNANFNETIPENSQWNISWKFAANSEPRVSVIMNEQGDGTFTVGGCHVLNDTGADYVGTNCTVVRAD